MTIKKFNTIGDFYQFINKPDNVPSTHRHFNVFFYPDLYSVYNTNGPGQLNNAILELFNDDILNKVTLSIQSITLPQKMSIGNSALTVETPIGKWNSTDQNGYYNTDSNQLTFTLIDSMVPLFLNFFNHWMLITSLCLTNSIGYLFPRVNISIKYFRLDYAGIAGAKSELDFLKLVPQFVYYFKGAYPLNFSTCSIAHSADQQEEITRTLVMQFNNCWCFGSKLYALKYYKLGYLFN